jgi:hypothetical protein
VSQRQKWVFLEEVMEMVRKRTVEVFVAGCPLCDDAVKLVRETACPN